MKKILRKVPEKKLSFGFVTDPLDGFDLEAETSLFLMREISDRGHRLFAFEPKDIFLKQNEVWAEAKQIEIRRGKKFYKILERKPLSLMKLDTLFLRKDPPFDLNYLFHLWLLSKLEGKVRMINEPSSILKYNEKLSALDFPFGPKTWVGSNGDALKKWGASFKQGIVVKPLNSSGGRGVRWIQKVKNQEPKTKNQEPVIAQEFLPAVKKGDKRVILWNGRVIGAFLRRPTKKGEFRANLHLGGKFEKTSLTLREKKIAQTIARWSKKEKLYFVGLDLIGGYLTEINVTSPLGIRELNVLYGLKVEETMIRDVNRLCLKN